jgi:hypothetical protein
MKNQRRFKATNYSRGCLLAKAFGISAANSGERTLVIASTRERRRTHLACNASPARTEGGNHTIYVNRRAQKSSAI